MYTVRLDRRLRRLGTSGLLPDIILDQNVPAWQTGLGLEDVRMVVVDWQTGTELGLGLGLGV